MDIFEIWYQRKGKSFKSMLTRALWINSKVLFTRTVSILLKQNRDIKLFYPSMKTNLHIMIQLLINLVEPRQTLMLPCLVNRVSCNSEYKKPGRRRRERRERAEKKMEERPQALWNLVIRRHRLRERERKHTVVAVGGERRGSALGGEQQGGWRTNNLQITHFTDIKVHSSLACTFLQVPSSLWYCERPTCRNVDYLNCMTQECV